MPYIIFLISAVTVLAWLCLRLRSALHRARAEAARLLLAERAHQEEYRRFAAMVTHEFRTPLATIDGAIQLLELTAAGAPEPTRMRYRKIQGAVERLLALVDEYLSPQRMASIGRTPDPKDTAAHALLEGAAAQARSATHTLTLHTRGLPSTLRCDPDGMRLCLQVLLDNAIKYTPHGSAIELIGRAAPQGGVDVIVQDDGPGVVEEDIPHLFEKFFRGRNVDAQPGSGLGLYMAHAVIEAHGGTLTLQNRPEGGAQFCIWLPCAGNSRKSPCVDSTQE